jgi:hypothetical protein
MVTSVPADIVVPDAESEHGLDAKVIIDELPLNDDEAKFTVYCEL